MYKLFLILFACAPLSYSNSNETNNTKKSEKNHVHLVVDNGNKILTDKSFIVSIKKSCNQSGAKNCIYYNETKEENFGLEKNHLTEIIYSDDKITLQKKYSVNATDEEDEIRDKTIFLEIVKEAKIVNNLQIYGYYSEDYFYTERSYYLDKNFNLWVLDIISEEGMLSARSWRKYIINKNNGTIRKDKSVLYNSAPSENHIYNPFKKIL